MKLLHNEAQKWTPEPFIKLLLTHCLTKNVFQKPNSGFLPPTILPIILKLLAINLFSCVCWFVSATANAVESIRELPRLKEMLTMAEEILRQIKAEEEKFQKRNQEAQRKFEVMSNKLPFWTLLTCCCCELSRLSLTLLLLLATHARARTHDATLGNTFYMERSLF